METGDRETGVGDRDRRQETGDRRWETGDRRQGRQKTGDRRWEIGDRSRERLHPISCKKLPCWFWQLSCQLDIINFLQYFEMTQLA